eukprot:8109453-Pyramimonas_sp.AAC.1
MMWPARPRPNRQPTIAALHHGSRLAAPPTLACHCRSHPRPAPSPPPEQARPSSAGDKKISRRRRARRRPPPLVER